MVKIRLRRTGAKKQPHYRVVVADSRSPRDGKFIETIGHYNPRTEPPTVEINTERALYWLSVGAQPTEAVRRMLDKLGIMSRVEALRKGDVKIEEVLAEMEAAQAQAEEAPAEEAPVEEVPLEEAAEAESEAGAELAEAGEEEAAGVAAVEEAAVEAEQEAAETEAVNEDEETEVEDEGDNGNEAESPEDEAA